MATLHAPFQCSPEARAPTKTSSPETAQGPSSVSSAAASYLRTVCGTRTVTPYSNICWINKVLEFKKLIKIWINTFLLKEKNIDMIYQNNICHHFFIQEQMRWADLDTGVQQSQACWPITSITDHIPVQCEEEWTAYKSRCQHHFWIRDVSTCMQGTRETGK